MSFSPKNAGLKSRLQAPHVWAFTTYFAEGFPYTLIRMVSSVYFRDMKVILEAIGLTSVFGVPWVIKFLWGPHIDQFGTKRLWMLGMQCALLFITALVGLLTPLPNGIPLIALLLFLGSFLAATHDMAIEFRNPETILARINHYLSHRENHPLIHIKSVVFLIMGTSTLHKIL